MRVRGAGRRRDDRAGDRARPGRVGGGRRAAAARPRRGRAEHVAVAARRRQGAARRAPTRGRASDPGSLARALEGCDVLVNSASYRVNLDAMRACLEAGCHYLDLGGLYWMTDRQLELDRRVRARRAAGAARHRLAPGQDEPDGGARSVQRELGTSAAAPSRLGARVRRRARPRPAAGVQRSLRAADAGRRADDAAGGAARRRARGDRAAQRRRGGRLRRADRRRARRSTRSTPSCAPSARASAAARRASGCRCRPTCSASSASWPARPEAEVDAARPRPRRPPANTVSVHMVEASAGERAVRVRAVTEPIERWGLGGGIVSTAAPAAAAVRLLAAGAIDARGRAPARALHRARRPVRRARAARLSVRGHELREEVRA